MYLFLISIKSHQFLSLPIQDFVGELFEKLIFLLMVCDFT